MLQTTNFFAKTTAIGLNYDIISDVLRSMRIDGSTLLNNEYATPWAIAIPDADRIATLMELKVGIRTVVFHLVKRGYVEIKLPNGHLLIVEAGEIAICFGGEAHQIFQGTNSQVLHLEKLLSDGKNIFEPTNKEVRSSSLICGAFLLHYTQLNPLFASLPSWLHVSNQSFKGTNNFSLVAQIMIQEVDGKLIGREYVVERLLELLCAEAIRSHIELNSTQTIGWFTALKDPIVSGAIALIHNHPGYNWTVKCLAEYMAISPSRLAARFVLAMGESPIAYVAKWRMNLASRLLVQSKKAVSEIAAEVGYESLPAFNRAFKKHLGLPPATWRLNYCS